MGTEEAYRAVASRDARFDGCFVHAVRTTGIYCRPSCPARTPKRDNSLFFPTAAAAQAAGEPLDTKPVSMAIDEVYDGRLQVVHKE